MAASRSRGTVSQRLGQVAGSRAGKVGAMALLAVAGGPALLGLVMAGMLAKGAATGPKDAPWSGGFRQLTAGSPNLGRAVGATARGVGRTTRSSGPGWGR